MTDGRRRIAMVTGASSGIGAVYADRLARRGYDLILVARNSTRLTTVEQIAAKAGGRVEPFVADLNRRSDLARVEERLRTDPRVALLVNNAGIGAVDPLLAADIEKMEAMIGLNVIALTRLTYAAAPQFVSRGGGTIVNIASAVAIAPELLNGVYGATKAFVLALTLSLNKELSAAAVRVQAVLPGAIATNFWEAAGSSLAGLPNENVMTADDLVDAALAGLDAGELVTIPSLPDAADWDTYEASRQRMIPLLSRRFPASRYRI